MIPVGTLVVLCNSEKTPYASWNSDFLDSIGIVTYKSNFKTDYFVYLFSKQETVNALEDEFRVIEKTS